MAGTYDAYNHQESIYNIVPPKDIPQEKPPMYRSKFNPKAHPTGTTFITAGGTNPLVNNISGDGAAMPAGKKEGRTMGKPPGCSQNFPTSYMKKNARTTSVESLHQVKKSNPSLLQPTQLKPKMKADVPKLADQPPVMNLVTSKNFVVANAVETILAAPKKVTQGAKEYLHKEDYGKVPKYLTHIKNDIQAEYDYIQQMHEQEIMEASAGQAPLTEGDRLALLNGLKAKWESVNTEYQAATHVTLLDTQGKMYRKEKNEASLSQLEKDIERLNKKNIVIDQFS